MGISATAQWITELSYGVLLVLFFVLRWAVNTWAPHMSRPWRIGLAVAWLGFCVMAVTASHVWKEWYITPNEPLYASVEAAAEDGCVVIRAPHLLWDGEEHWDDFVCSVDMGLPYFVSIAMYDGGEIRQVDELVYDGAGFMYVDRKPFKNHKEDTETYPYLLHLDGMWVLTDKADLTLTELERTKNDTRRGYAYRVIWSD